MSISWSLLFREYFAPLYGGVDMNTLSAIFGFGACIGLIGLISWTIVDAFRVLKYGLEGDEDDE